MQTQTITAENPRVKKVSQLASTYGISADRAFTVDPDGTVVPSDEFINALTPEGFEMFIAIICGY